VRASIVGKFVGSSVTRKEDRRLLTGKGNYIADVVVDDMTHAAFLRSPHPHAEILQVDVGAARRSPGVVAIYTGAEMQAKTNPFVNLGMLPGLYSPPFWPLAVDRVRMVGDPVALVIASSRAEAEDALVLIDMSYRVLPPVGTIGAALVSSSEKLWPKNHSNVMFDHTDTFGDVDSVFASAPHVFTERFTSHRQSNQPMETRGCVAEVTPSELVFHSATQSAHSLRWILAMGTSKSSVRDSFSALNSNRTRLKAFGKGAKDFVTSNKADLGKGDNAGMLHQIRKDPSTLKHMGKLFANTLAVDSTRLPRVVAGDIGGAFGVKGHSTREDVAICAAALDLGRSVKWIEDRVEHLTVGGTAREETITLSMAVDNQGHVLGMRADLVMDQGAYPAIPFGAPLFSRIMKLMMPGTYRPRAFELRTRTVATNKSHYVAYRGPWANETWARERMLDVVARRLGLSATEIRLRNMYGASELPVKMITGPTLDKEMSAKATLEKAIEEADVPAFREVQAAARATGRLLGIGFATFHEAAPGPPDYADALLAGGGMLSSEPVRTVLEADGTVSLYTQQVPHGQSHETTFAQVAADELGVPLDQVRVVFGDTNVTPFSVLGTGGSRGGPMAGGASMLSSKELRTQIVREASDLLEAHIDDVQITDGNIHVAGVPSRGVTFADVAAAARTGGRGELSSSVSYNGGAGGWVQATHVCVVEIDPGTGLVSIPRYIVVEDCGDLINPAIVEGQIRGGVAQGVGAVLYEKVTYDAEANFQSSTFIDYLIPTAMEIPTIEIHHLETPSDKTANFRGVGEGGMIGAPAAITNAVEDALTHLGVTITEQYLPPTRILELIGAIERD
jgi:aerobic carbon-monoxide dehydrogenase large subunit